MKRQTFNTCFAAMAKAYLYSESKIDPETADVYWEMLKNIPDDKFNLGVRDCLAKCKFFPTIAELGQASLPTIKRLAPYNPYSVQEPREIGWQEQVRELERGQLSENIAEIKSLT